MEYCLEQFWAGAIGDNWPGADHQVSVLDQIAEHDLRYDHRNPQMRRDFRHRRRALTDLQDPDVLGASFFSDGTRQRRDDSDQLKVVATRSTPAARKEIRWDELAAVTLRHIVVAHSTQ
jgi:hypothetical protein